MMSRVVLRPPCRKGRRSCSRQASSMTRRMRRSPSASPSLDGGGFRFSRPAAFAAQDVDQVRYDGGQVLGLFAKLGPEDAVEIGVLDVLVVGQRFGERGLAVAARAAQRRRDGDRVALGVEQFALKRLELHRTLNEVRRRLRRHHRHAASDSSVPRARASASHAFRECPDRRSAQSSVAAR